MITHLTAASSRLVSACSPYMNSAIYLIGPTSASNLRYCFSYPNFSSRTTSITFCSPSIQPSRSVIRPSISCVLLLASLRNPLIRLLMSATSLAYLASIAFRSVSSCVLILISLPVLLKPHQVRCLLLS